jgi:hypothetical protein
MIVWRKAIFFGQAYKPQDERLNDEKEHILCADAGGDTLGDLLACCSSGEGLAMRALASTTLFAQPRAVRRPPLPLDHGAATPQCSTWL